MRVKFYRGFNGYNKGDIDEIEPDEFDRINESYQSCIEIERHIKLIYLTHINGDTYHDLPDGNEIDCIKLFYNKKEALKFIEEESIEVFIIIDGEIIETEDGII